MENIEKIIYLAGIIDGEGCVKVNHRQKYLRARCVVSNTSEELIDWLHGNFGGHLVPVKREGNRKLQYRWDLRKKEIAEILPKVIPYLIVKKEEAKESLKLAEREIQLPWEKGHVPWNKGKKLHYPVWNKGMRGKYKLFRSTKNNN